MKRFLSIAIVLCFLFNSFGINVITAEETENKSKVEFKYSKYGNEDEFLSDDDKLEAGNIYELSIYMSDFDSLFGFAMPIHFNNKVVELINYDNQAPIDEKVFTSNEINKMDENVLNPSAPFKMSDEFFNSVWLGEDLTTGSILYNDIYPSVNNDLGLIKLSFGHGFDNGSIAGSNLLMKVLFRVIGEGNTDFRPATVSDGKINGSNCYDAVYEKGFDFYASGVGSSNITGSVDVLTSNKSAVIPPQNVVLDKDSIEILTTNNETLNYNVYPDTASDKSVVWSTSDESIASVDENGTVSALSQGEAEITVTTKYGGHEDKCLVKVIDINTPTIPTGLDTTLVTGKRVSLTWDKSNGVSGVDGYKIYRDGKEIANIKEDSEIDKMSYTDMDSVLLTGATYSYSVSAYYGEAESTQTTPLIVTTSAPNISLITPRYDEEFGGTTQKFSVFYDNTKNYEGTTLLVTYSDEDGSYKNYTPICSSNNGSLFNSFEFDMDLSLIKSGNVYFDFIVRDVDGCECKKTIRYSVDSEPPAKVNEFTAYNDEGMITLVWQKSNETDANEYRIYKSEDENSFGDSYISVQKELNSYVDTNVEIGKTYYYYIVAVDKYMLVSEASEVQSATPMVDTIAPEILSISLKSGEVISSEKTVNIVATDNIGIERIVLQSKTSDGDFIDYKEITGTDSADFVINANDFDNGEITIRAIAFDAKGNESDGTPTRKIIIDTIGPEKVTGFVNSSVKSTTVQLKWNDVSDADRGFFRVEKSTDGEKFEIVDDVKLTNGINVTGLLPETLYYFKVTAYDIYNNRGEESDIISVTTNGDVTAPIIEQISPLPKRTKDDINLAIKATDDYEISTVEVQTSVDKLNWETKTVLSAKGGQKSETLYYTLKANELSEGDLYVRAIPTDINGNVGDSSSNAPFNSYFIDKTAPKRPSNVKLEENEGNLDISWDIATDTDVERYVVLRSEYMLGSYVTLTENCKNTNYIDTGLRKSQTYYYKIQAYDTCGNISDYSSIVSGKTLPDTIAPEIISFAPKTGSYINDKAFIYVNAHDNGSLSKVGLEYKNDFGNWVTIGTKYADSSYYTGKFSLDSLAFGDGEYTFRGYASDIDGNEITGEEITYTIDNSAPYIANANAQTKNVNQVTLNWQSENTDNLSGFKIYKKTKTSEYPDTPSYTCSNKNMENYSFECNGLYSDTMYMFKIVAIDFAGNESSVETGYIQPLGEIIEELDTTPPVGVMNVPQMLEVGVSGTFDATGSVDDVKIESYVWDFGDNKTLSGKTVDHSFAQSGVYKVELVITDISGNQCRMYKNVTVNEKTVLSDLTINVVDDFGQSVSNAIVVFNFGSDSKSTYYTDMNGKVVIKSKEGIYPIGVYKDGYLPAEKKVSIRKNLNSELTVRVIKKDIVVGSLTWKRMTLKDVVDAGIDTTDPANQNLYEFNISLVIGKQVVNAKGYKPLEDNTPIRVVLEDETLDNIDRVVVNNRGKLVNSVIYIYDYTDYGSDKDNYRYSSDDYTAHPPKTILTMLEVPGEASWLKEFFDVSLDVVNQADEEFVIDNCNVRLNYPHDGLSMVEGVSSDYATSEYTEIGSIKGQQKKTVNWVLRGDKVGDYDISADFHGTLRGFDKSIDAQFKADKPIKVYGSSEMSLLVEAEEDVTDYDDYVIRVGLKNSSDISRYMSNVNLREDEYVSVQPGYEKYIESESGNIFASSNELKSGESIFANYIVDINAFAGDKAQVLQMIVEKLSGNISLPINAKFVKSLSNQKNEIELYEIDSNNSYNRITDCHMTRSDKKTIVVKVTDVYPGEKDSIPVKNTKIYMKQNSGEYVLKGTTDNNGMLLINDFTIGEDYESSYCELTFRSNRTGELKLPISVLGEYNRATVEGTIRDEWGNPMDGAKVTYGDSEPIYADEFGKFVISGLTPADFNVKIEQSDYETYEGIDSVVRGKNNFVYTLKEEYKVTNPVITGIDSDIFKYGTNYAIIPEGLDYNANVYVTAVADAIDSISGVNFKLVDENGNTVKEYESNGMGLDKFNLSDLREGYTLMAQAVSQLGYTSEWTAVDFIVKKSPFVNLLNNSIQISAWDTFSTQGNAFTSTGLSNTGSSSGISTGNSGGSGIGISVKVISSRFGNPGSVRFTAGSSYLVRPLSNGEYWLDGEFKDKWENIYTNLNSQFGVDVFAGDNSIDMLSSTNMIMNWFEDGNIPIYMDYNFYDGSMTISTYRPDNTTGRLTVNELINGESAISASSKFSWLNTWNMYYMPINSTFGFDFSYNGNGWDGDFKIQANSINDFLGSFGMTLRRLNNQSEVLTNIWNKNITFIDNATVPLNSGAMSNDDEFKMDYNANTKSSWKSGLTSVSFYADTKNSIYLLPQLRLKGQTTLCGAYSNLGFKSMNRSTTNTIAYDENLGNLMSLNSLDEAEKQDESEMTFSVIKPHTNNLMNLFSVEDNGVLESGVFENTDTSVSTDAKTMVYVDSDTDRECDLDGAALYARKRNKDNSWGTATLVDDDGTADYTPTVENITSGTIAAWANSTESAATFEDKTDWTMEEIEQGIASKLAITTAIYKTKNKGWENVTQISSNTCLNHSPVIAETDAGTVVAWISNDENNLSSSDRQDSLKYSLFNGTDWTEESIILDNFGAISDLKLKSIGSNAILTFAVSELNNDVAIDKYYIMRYINGSWDSAHRIISNGIEDNFCDFVTLDGISYILLFNNGFMYKINPTTKDINTDVIEIGISKTSQEVSVAQNEDNLALVWISDKDGKQSICANIYDFISHSFSEPIVISNVGELSIARNLNASFVNSSLEVVYNELVHGENAEGEIDIVDVLLKHSEYAQPIDIKALELVADEVVIPNKPVDFKLSMSNNGIKKTEGFDITLYKDEINETNKIKSVHVDNGLDVGEQRAVDITWIAEGITGNHTIIAVINCEGDTGGNNSAECTLISRDVSIKSITSNQYNTGVTVTATIENSGYSPINNVKLRLYDSSNNLIGEDVVTETLDISETYDVMFNLPVVYSNTQNGLYQLRAELIADFDEFNTANNTKSSALKLEDLGIEIGNSKVNGGVDVELRADNEQKGVKAELYKDNIKMGCVYTDANGKFDFSNIAPGTYDLVLNGKSILKRIVKNVSINEDSNSIEGNIGLLQGDVMDDDGVIDISDIALIICTYGSGKGSTMYNVNWDFDYNGSISQDELRTVIKNYSKTTQTGYND